MPAIPSVPHAHHRQWTNWGGNQSATPAHTFRPRTEAEVVDVVGFAAAEGLPVRAVGASHSFTPLVQTGGVLLDLAEVSGVTGVDAATGRVRARGGTAIREFGPPLWEAGLSLANQGDIDKQAIGGALSTATHGSGIELGSFSSALCWARILTGTGDIVEVGESDLRTLRAAQVALGTLGILLEVELQAVPRYHLAERITYPLWEETAERWERDIAENRHYSFLWSPYEDSSALYELPTPADLPMTDRSYTKMYNAVELDEAADLSAEKGARRDRAYRIYPGGFGIPFHELEYMVPAEHGFAAVSAVRTLMRTRHTDQHYPIEVRWVRGDDGLLSPFQGRDTTVVSVSGAPGADYWRFLLDVDALLRDYDARAHWGKIHFLTRERTAALYPGFADFVGIRRAFDPQGVFLNDHTRALVG
ncbi:D-arabinono-1,4-lactone oxidase [Nocardiopsis coralliicola]